MQNGSLNLTFESPDFNLTGSGDFDISEYLKSVFYENPTLKTVLSEKVSDIFSEIDTKKVATNWTNKIKESFTIEDEKINLKTIIEEQIKKAFKGFKINPMEDLIKTDSIVKKTNKTNKTPIDSTIELKDQTNIKNLENKFTLFVKDMFKKDLNFPSLWTINQNLLKIVKANTIKDVTPIIGGNADTVFDQTLDVNLADISTEAMKKLSSIFGSMGLSDNTEAVDIEKPQKGLFDKIVESMLGPVLGGTAASLLRGLGGAALLAGGLIWMAVDGIRGWFKSDEWGVSKISGAIGGMLGGLDSGIMGGLKNMGKWALIGAGIGSIVPVVGTLAGAMLGAGIGFVLGWIGGKNLATAFDIIAKKLNTNFFQAIGLFGVGDDDPTRGVRKLIMVDIPKWFITKLPNILSTSFFKLATVFEKFGMEKATTASLSIGAKAVGSTVLKRILKYIPIVGALISLGEAFDRFKNGNITGGLIALSSGIAGIIPGVGTGISIALDVLNAGLDIKYGGDKGRSTSGFNSLWKDKFMPFLRKIPLIGTLMIFGEALGAFSTGDWSTGLDLLGEAGVITFGSGILELFGIGSDSKKSFVSFREGFIQFGEALGQGMSDILDSILNTWTNIKSNITGMFTEISNVGQTIYEWVDTTITSTIEKTKEGFYKLFDWFNNLGPMLLDKFKGWFTSKETETQIGSVHGVPLKEQKTQALIVDTKTQNIAFQPDNQDKMYSMGNTDIFAKPDDILGKTFENINKQLENLNKTMIANVNILNLHTKVFNEILNVEQGQLQMLPTLASQPSQPDKSTPSSEIRDSIFDYRTRVAQYATRVS